MKKFLSILFVLFAFSASAQTKIPKSAFSAQVAGKNFDGDYLKVTFGGDTLILRLIGLNAPERKWGGICKADQPHAHEAKNALAQLCPIGSFIVIDTLTQRDKFNRVQARAWVGTTDVTLSMIRNGHAWYEYNAKIPSKARTEYSTAEKIAILENKGLWDNETYPAKPRTPAWWKKKYGYGFIFRSLRKEELPSY